MDCKGSSGLSEIQKLQGSSNYADWKFAVSNYLENNNWWHVIESDNAESINKDIDRKARTTINLLLELSCYSHVYDAKTASKVWNNLRQVYEDKGWGRRIGLQRMFWQCRLENFESMEKYIAKVMFLTKQLKDIDAKVEDSWIISILLSGLTAEYGPMIMAIDNSGQGMKLEQIKTKFLQEYNHQTDQVSASTSTEQALVVYKKSTDMKPYFRKAFKCYKCHNPGIKLRIAM